MSDFSLRLKHEKRTLRCDGLKPSTILGIERNKSALENKMSSLLINSSYRMSSPVMSKKVPGSYAVSHALRSSTRFLLNDMSIKSPSPSLCQTKLFRW